MAGELDVVLVRGRHRPRQEAYARRLIDLVARRRVPLLLVHGNNDSWPAVQEFRAGVTIHRQEREVAGVRFTGFGGTGDAPHDLELGPGETLHLNPEGSILPHPRPAPPAGSRTARTPRPASATLSRDPAPPGAPRPGLWPHPPQRRRGLDRPHQSDQAPRGDAEPLRPARPGHPGGHLPRPGALRAHRARPAPRDDQPGTTRDDQDDTFPPPARSEWEMSALTPEITTEEIASDLPGPPSGRASASERGKGWRRRPLAPLLAPRPRTRAPTASSSPACSAWCATAPSYARRSPPTPPTSARGPS